MEEKCFIKRTNISDDCAITLIGKRFLCGLKATPFDTKRSAESALKTQIKQDNELCADCIIKYTIIDSSDDFVKQYISLLQSSK